MSTLTTTRFAPVYNNLIGYMRIFGKRKKGLTLRMRWEGLEVWLYSSRHRTGGPPEGAPLNITVVGEDRSPRSAGELQADGSIRTHEEKYPREQYPWHYERRQFGATLEEWEKVWDLLSALSKEPGTLSTRLIGSGKCCFCHRPLEDARSTHAGYGPDCAGMAGLPW